MSLNRLDPPSVTEDEVRGLKAQLRETREDILSMMSDEVHRLLWSFHSCRTDREFHAWQEATVAAIVARAEPDPETLRFQPRARCPLCNGHSQSAYVEGFALPEGLRRHLVGFGNTRICPVTKAALAIARDGLRETLARARADERLLEARRRDTERVFLVAPGEPPRLIEERLWGRRPRDVEDLEAAERRLRNLGFTVGTEGNVTSYKLARDGHFVLADPRAAGRIDFAVWREGDRDGRPATSGFHLLDSWARDIQGKFDQRIASAIESLANR